MNDLDWVFNELVQWVFMNVQAKWASVVKRGRDKVSTLCVNSFRNRRQIPIHPFIGFVASRVVQWIQAEPSICF